MMKVIDILEHFLSRSSWIDRANTVDRVIIGNPESKVDRCLVTWMPSFGAVRQAVASRVGLIVCHEPTFYSHQTDRFDIHPETARIVFEKRDFINQHGLTILRLHDTWDRWPDIGIPWAWGRFLELPAPPAAISPDKYQHRYDIKPVTLDQFARHVARKCASIGEPAVQVTGDGRQLVSKIGAGTGCGCNLDVYRRIGCDCSIVCDDGSCYWAGIQMAEDWGNPVIRVNHGTSEEPGMVTLTKYINDNLDLRAEHLPHGCTFRLVAAD
jgi:putative NIF3 family GTP cyclohydrolase 1 type 2